MRLAIAAVQSPAGRVLAAVPGALGKSVGWLFWWLNLALLGPKGAAQAELR